MGSNHGKYVEVVYPVSVYVLSQIAYARLAVSLSELKYGIYRIYINVCIMNY